MREMADDAMRYVDLPYAVTITEEALADGRPWYVARHPELPGCMSDGATPDLARANLDDARALYITSLLDDGLPVPTPVRQIAKAS